MLLTDRVVIVSGVGPGLGHALALACVDHGARVVLVARTEERVAALASTITARGGEAVAVRADASNPADTNRIVDATLERFGHVDGLVNNAAVIPPLAPIAEVATDVLEQSLDGNLLSAFHLSPRRGPRHVAAGARFDRHGELSGRAPSQSGIWCVQRRQTRDGRHGPAHWPSNWGPPGSG